MCLFHFPFIWKRPKNATQNCFYDLSFISDECYVSIFLLSSKLGSEQAKFKSIASVEVNLHFIKLIGEFHVSHPRYSSETYKQTK